MRNLTGVVDADRVALLSSPADLVESPSGEKAVTRVSGVPLNESAPPLDECGEDGLKGVSRVWAMVGEVKKIGLEVLRESSDLRYVSVRYPSVTHVQARGCLT